MIDCILDTVVSVLAGGGIPAFREFPARLPDRELCVTVGAREFKLSASGMGDYIGVRVKENGECAEIFGKRVELELEFEIFAPLSLPDGAKACLGCAEALCALTERLPEGLKVLAFVCGEVSADEALSAFRCVCRAPCLALFFAESGGEQGEFLDFILKGAVDGVN